MTLSLGLAAAFGSVAVLFLTLQDLFVERRQSYKQLRQIEAASRTQHATQRERELAVPLFQRLLLPGMKQMGALGRRFTPISVLERLDEELVYAGSPKGWDGERILALKVTFTAAMAIIGAILPGVLGFGAARAIITAPLAGAIGWYLPEWTLRARSGERQKKIQRALPDALDLMSITVEAGLGFDSALDRVAKEMGGPLGEELYRVNQEMRLGKSRSEALRDLGQRSPLQELRSFVLAMVQADIFGIPISRVLHVQSRELRLKRRQRAEEMAQKLPVKIIFPLILCIFPSLFIILLGPAAIQIYESIIKD